MREELIEILNVSWPSMVIVLSILLIVRIAYFINHKRKFSLSSEIMLFIFIAYVLILFQLVTYKNNEYAGLNLVPFNEILRYDFGTKEFIRQVIGNILIFIPFGYFVTYYVNLKRIRDILFMVVPVSVIIEIVQYNIGRSFDIDDILLNTIGGIAGFLIFVALNAVKKRLPGILQKDFIYTILSLLLVIFIVLYTLGIISF